MDKTRTTARILIVEDDGIIAYSLQSLVELLGYEVVDSVPSGEDAIQKAAEQRPDLILMDVGLVGELDGVETAIQIQARSDIPVIFLTGYDRDVLFRDITVSGPYACLSKPVYKKELGGVLEKMLAWHNSGLEKKRIGKETD